MTAAREVSLSVRQALLAYFLLCILFSILPVYRGNHCGRGISQEFSAAKNRVLRNSTIWLGRVGTLVGCVSLCHSWTACKSVNYFKNNRMCDLNNATRADAPEGFVEDQTSVYFDGNTNTSCFSVADFSDHSNVHTTGFTATVEPRYSDCQSLLKEGYSASGIYTIFPGGFTDGLRVYCDMEADGGGWLFIQRRQDGSVDFYRGWAYYRVGFGDLAGEFWLGNDNLRTLTNSTGSWDLRIDLEDWDGNTAWAEYRDVRIIGHNFRLSFDSYNADSNAGNSLYTNNGLLFTTKDNNNNMFTDRDCAKEKKGAWWYKNCSQSNLNGMYFNSSREIPNDVGVMAWNTWRGRFYSLKSCSMKMRLAK